MLLFFIAIIGTSHGCKEHESLPIVTRHDVLGWPRAGVIALRCTDQSCAELLLNIPEYPEKGLLIDGKEYRPVTPVVKYSKRTGLLVPVTPDDWTRSTQEVLSTLCTKSNLEIGKDGSWSVGNFRFSLDDYSATCSGKAVESRGRAILSMNDSPDGKYVSILSAARAPSGGLPFAKNQIAKGAHYIEVWDAKACRKVGKSYKIDGPEGLCAPSVSWAPDSQMIVLLDVIMNRAMWFVPVPSGKVPTESSGKNGE